MAGLELSLLGALIRSKSSDSLLVSEAFKTITTDSFVDYSEAALYDTLAAMYRDGINFEVPYILTKAQQTGAGSVVTVDFLEKTLGHSGDLQSLLALHKTAFITRQAVDALTTSLEQIKEGEDIVDVLVSTQKNIATISLTSGGKEAVAASKLLESEISDIATRVDNGGTDDRLSFGFSSLDGMGKMGEGMVVVIAARPGMGKSVLAMNIAAAAAAAGVGVCFFSLEMSKSELMQRCISSLGKVRLDRITNGSVITAESDRILSLRGNPLWDNLWIDDTSSITVDQIAVKATHHQAKHGLGLIVVDYLQLISSKQSKTVTRETEVATITRGLKLLAKELRVPIIAVSQLNRALEARDDKRPWLSDLRESGAIEQDADKIIFIYRDGYYRESKATTEEAELIVAKNRNGKTGTAHVSWCGDYVSFFEQKP